VPPDPVRTRVGFFGLLAPRARLAFLNEVLEKFLRDLAKLEAKAEHGTTNPFERLAVRGSYLALQARVTWVKEMIAALCASEDARTARNNATGTGGS
jgi:hypothetical protein